MSTWCFHTTDNLVFWNGFKQDLQNVYIFFKIQYDSKRVTESVNSAGACLQSLSPSGGLQIKSMFKSLLRWLLFSHLEATSVFFFIFIYYIFAPLAVNPDSLGPTATLPLKPLPQPSCTPAWLSKLSSSMEGDIEIRIITWSLVVIIMGRRTARSLSV